MVGYQRVVSSVQQQHASVIYSPASRNSSIATDDDSDDSDSECNSFAPTADGHINCENAGHNGRQTIAVRSNTNTHMANSAANQRNAKAPSTVQRLPTRRPNPTIHNRNALMARENRKKKKEHVETLERDVNELRDENDTLRKLLHKRSTMVHKLRDERLYLKSIIANKTSIMAMLQTIQGNQLPITSSTMDFVVAHNDDEEQQQQQQQLQHQQNQQSSTQMMQDSRSSSGCSSIRTTDSDFGTMQSQHESTARTSTTMQRTTTLTLGTVPPLPPLFLFSDDELDLSPSRLMVATEACAAAQLSHDASVSPVDGLELPALPWDDAVIDDNDDRREFAEVAYRPNTVGHDVDMSATDTVDDEEDEDDDDNEDEDDNGVEAEEKQSDEEYYDDYDSEIAQLQLPHRFKVSHEHNYSNNHINEQLRTPSGNNRATTARNASNDSSCCTTAAQHMHHGGKVRPSAYALETQSSQPHPTSSSGPGICLHLSGGRVSLEFCVSCHRHAQNAWDEAEEDEL